MSGTKEVVPDRVRQSEAAALQRIIDASNLLKKDVIAKSKIGNPSYLTQLLNGDRPLNLTTACQLAAALGVKLDELSPRLAQTVREAGYLLEQGVTSVPIVREPEPAYRVSDWPFSSITPAEFQQISPMGRAELEGIARGMVIESRRKKQAAA